MITQVESNTMVDFAKLGLEENEPAQPESGATAVAELPHPLSE